MSNNNVNDGSNKIKISSLDEGEGVLINIDTTTYRINST